MAEGIRFSRRLKLTKHQAHEALKKRQAREALKRVAAGEPLCEIAFDPDGLCNSGVRVSLVGRGWGLPTRLANVSSMRAS